MGQWWI